MKTKTAAKQTGRARLGQFLGFSVVSVIRQMGKSGWTAEEVTAALAKAKITPAPNTIYIQLNAGRKGSAKPADIDPKKLEALRPKITAPEADKGDARAEKKAKSKATK